MNQSLTTLRFAPRVSQRICIGGMHATNPSRKRTFITFWLLLAAGWLLARGARAEMIITDPNLGDTPPFIQLLGINNAGTIVGYTGSGVINPNSGFILNLPSMFTTLNPNLTGGFTNAQTQIFGISGNGMTTAGFVIDTNGVMHGFVDPGNGPTATPVDDPNAVSNATPAVNQLLGLNQAASEAAGFYTDAGGVTHGYTYTLSGAVFTPLNIPGSLGFVSGDSSMATGVNNSGMVSGFFTNTMMVSFGFLYNGTNTYTPISPPGATSTQPLSLNDLADVVGTYVGMDVLNHGFLFDGTKYITFDGVPGASMNLIQGINDAGQIVGFAVTNATSGATEGFDAALPEPSTLMLSGIGLLALLAVRKVRR